MARAHSTPPRRDPYANLLKETRGLRRDQAGARDQWFADLPWEGKEEALFELEMLLKGVACFGNPRNHPGDGPRGPHVARDYRTELQITNDAVQHGVGLIRQLLGERDRAFTFARYLESVLPEDTERTRLIKDQLSQNTPEEALFALRNSLSSFVEVMEGLQRLGRISHRLHQSMLGIITREIGRNAYFNPLQTLEFRAEFDRIRQPQVLEAMESIEGESTHRVAALGFLTLFRALRYTSLLERYARDPATTSRSYVILAVLRSDVRALVRFLERSAGPMMADGLERELLHIHASELAARHEAIAARAHVMAQLRRTVESLAHTLEVEVLRTFQVDLPPPDAEIPDAERSRRITGAAAHLRASLHHAIGALCRELRPDREAPRLLTDREARAAASERLRRDVWMFQQILRGFLAKAEAGSAKVDRWASHAGFQFVREFLEHFRAIGYQLVRMTDYARLDGFMRTLESLDEADVLDPRRLGDVVDECRSFYAYLEELFAKVSDRSELSGRPFDRKAAAETLRLYLHDRAA
ncbi:MAG: hypothetical protein ACOCXM_03845 [Myxococcota bacterium]